MSQDILSFLPLDVPQRPELCEYLAGLPVWHPVLCSVLLVTKGIPAVERVREGDYVSALREEPVGNVLARIAECSGHSMEVFLLHLCNQRIAVEQHAFLGRPLQPRGGQLAPGAILGPRTASPRIPARSARSPRASTAFLITFASCSSCSTAWARPVLVCAGRRPAGLEGLFGLLAHVTVAA